MLTSTAGVLLKKIGGGSAFTPSTFFGMIWLVSMLASTRSSAITRSSSGTDADDLLDHGPELLARHRREVGLGDLELREADEPLVQGDAGVGFHLEGAERGLLRALRRVGHRRVQDHVLLIGPARDLRLIDDERGAARRRVGARPRAALGGRRGGRGWLGPWPAPPPSAGAGVAGFWPAGGLGAVAGFCAVVGCRRPASGARLASAPRRAARSTSRAG